MTTTVFMEIDETVTDMTRQVDALMALATPNSNPRIKERLTAKARVVEVAAQMLVDLSKRSNTNLSTDEVYKTVLTGAIFKIRDLKHRIEKDGDNTEATLGTLQGNKLVAEKIRLARN